MSIWRFRGFTLAIAILLSAANALAQTIPPPTDTTEMLEKSDDGVDLCFLPVETVVGAQAHFIIETDPLRSDASVFNGLKATTLTVSNTGAPIVLIIETGHSNGDFVWRFNIEPGADLVGVHLVSDMLPTIEGLPASIPVTANYRIGDPDRDRRGNDCVFEDGGDSILTTFGANNSWMDDGFFRQFGGIFSLAGWEENLFDYAGIDVVSYQFSSGGWETATVEVSESSVQEFAATKARGQLLLNEAVPPEFPFLDETAEPLRVPEGLGRLEIWPWIFSMGYAMEAPEELYEYNCNIDRLFVLSLGLDVSSTSNCKWRNPRRRVQTWQDGIVVLGPLDMSEETCLASRIRGSIMSKPEVIITTDGSDCGISPVDLARKTYFH